MSSKIEQIIAGRVSLNDKRDEFYLRRGSSVFEFSLVAEGIRKIALLWQLVKNGILVDGSVLFRGVTVEEGAIVRNSVIMQSCIIKSGAIVKDAVIDRNNLIGKGMIIKGSSNDIYVMRKEQRIARRAGS